MMDDTLPIIKNLNDPVYFHGKTFIVLTVSREDIGKDFLNANKINDEDMKNIARKLGNNLMDDYWRNLDVILEDIRKEKKIA